MDYLFFIKIFVHYFLHFVFPGFIAWAFYKDDWKKVYLILLTTMLVDLDHLLATPVFDPERCSVGYHLLHSYYAIAVYIAGAVFLKGYYRAAAIGLLLHMLTDWQDYYLWKLFD